MTDGRPLLGPHRCAWWRSPAPWCSTTRDGDAASSSPSSRTTPPSDTHEAHSIFGRVRRCRTTARPVGTRISRPNTGARMDIRHQRSLVKQRRKVGGGIANRSSHQRPADLDVLARQEHLPELIDKARQLEDPPHDRACRPGLCHLVCPPRAHPSAPRTSGPSYMGKSLWGSTLHGPGRCNSHRRPRPRRLHEPEPSRTCRQRPLQVRQLIAVALRTAAPPSPRTDRTDAENGLRCPRLRMDPSRCPPLRYAEPACSDHGKKLTHHQLLSNTVGTPDHR
jgi:hypothetical protein